MENSAENTQANKAFTKQSSIFDAYYKPSPIVQYKRERVWALLQKYLKPNSRVLELNAGTGEDAVWLASQGHSVLATDVSPGMIAEQKAKVVAENLSDKIESRELSFLALDQLPEETFDAVFSNFGGLNCTDKLDHVLSGIAQKVSPGGVVCLVIMPPNCFWEWLWVFTGKFKKAFRRYGKNGAQAHIEGEYFTTWYYKASWVRKQLPNFKHLTTEALCLAVPPEHHKRLIENRPRLFRFLKWKESIIKTWPLLRGWGDYFVIVLQKPHEYSPSGLKGWHERSVAERVTG
jgi:ubiquinone/menaquinone biosynthesis C-methylase UbiE